MIPLAIVVSQLHKPNVLSKLVARVWGHVASIELVLVMGTEGQSLQGLDRSHSEAG